MRERTGGYPLPSFLRFAEPGRDTFLGASLALGCAVFVVALIYALLAVRGAFSEPSAPATSGLALFALLHGGAASVEVPPVPELFGIGGSLRLGLPITSFVLLPFLASLLGARFVATRVRTPLLFILVAGLTYAIAVAILAFFGATSTESGSVTVRLEPGPLSTALRGFLCVGLGTLLGTAATRGPLLPARVRQVLRGTLWAVGVSLAMALLLAVVISLAQSLGAPGTGAEQAPAQSPLQEAPEGLTPVLSGGGNVEAALTAVGTMVALAPVALAYLWLVAHGAPVGFQRAPDLGEIPLVGEALADVPLRVALLGAWPWGEAWRFLLLAPVVGLVVGGMISARGTPVGSRWRQGALVALPYAALAYITATLFGVTADITLAEAASIEVAFRASLIWLLLLVPIGAALGAVGGLLTRADAFPVAHPKRAFLATSIVSGLVLLASLPALFALSPGGAAPAGPLASEGEPFSASPEPSAEESTPPTEDESSPTPAEQGVADSPADPVFDPLLPTLTEKTSVPIMLPSELPEELQNVAVDADRSGEEYGILFLGEPSGNIEQSYVHAYDIGTLIAAPEPQYGTSDIFVVTSEETVELPDGREATLRYMEPREGELVNQGPYWEGSFEKEGHTYFLTVAWADPSGDIARQTLSSMVEVPDDVSLDDTRSEAEVVEAAEDYYEAVDREDWAYTYDTLDSETKALFSEDEWYRKNQYFADTEGLDLSAMDVQVNGSSSDPVVSVTVYRTFTDGTSITRDTYFVLEDGEWKHRFTEGEKEIFMPGVPYEEFVVAR
jgi:hypothetical protein